MPMEGAAVPSPFPGGRRGRLVLRRAPYYDRRVRMRRELPLDAGLVLRMAVATLLLFSVFIAVETLLVLNLVEVSRSGETGRGEPGRVHWLLSWVLLPVPLLAGVYMVLRAPSRALSSMKLEAATAASHPQLVEAVHRLSALAGVSAPKVAVSKSRVPTAFAVGISPGGSTVVVTEGLLELLEPPEVEAVLAHEVAHVAGRDGPVMTVAGSLAATIAAVTGMRFGYAQPEVKPLKEDPAGWLNNLLLRFVLLPLWLLALAAALSMSRAREHVADRGAVVLTGAPEHLMSALQKLSQPLSGIAEEDLRLVDRAGGLSIVPPSDAHWTLAWQYPPLDARLERLSAIARDLGRLG